MPEEAHIYETHVCSMENVSQCYLHVCATLIELSTIIQQGTDGPDGLPWKKKRRRTLRLVKLHSVSVDKGASAQNQNCQLYGSLKLSKLLYGFAKLTGTCRMLGWQKVSQYLYPTFA